MPLIKEFKQNAPERYVGMFGKPTTPRSASRYESIAEGGIATPKTTLRRNKSTFNPLNGREEGETFDNLPPFRSRLKVDMPRKPDTKSLLSHNSAVNSGDFYHKY